MPSDIESPSTEKETIQDVTLLLKLYDKRYGSSERGVKALKNRLLTVRCRSSWESFLHSAGKKKFLGKNEDSSNDTHPSNHLSKKRKIECSSSAEEADDLQPSEEKLKDFLKASSLTEHNKSKGKNHASCSKEPLEVSLLSDDERNSPYSVIGDLSDVDDQDTNSALDNQDRSHLMKSGKAMKKVTAFKSISRHTNQGEHLLIKEISRVEHSKRLTKDVKFHHIRTANGIHLDVSKKGVPSTQEESGLKTTLPSMKKAMKAKKSFPSAQTSNQELNLGTKVAVLEGPLVSRTARKSTGGTYSTKVINS